MSLAQAIARNRRREARRDRAERVLRQVRLRIFDYEDNGLGEKAAKVMETCKRICKPRWDARAATQNKKRTDRIMRTLE